MSEAWSRADAVSMSPDAIAAAMAIRLAATSATGIRVVTRAVSAYMVVSLSFGGCSGRFVAGFDQRSVADGRCGQHVAGRECGDDGDQAGGDQQQRNHGRDPGGECVHGFLRIG